MEILFVCSGNTCRSPMAEVTFNACASRGGREDLHASSAGLHAASGGRASRLAREVCKEYGLDLSGHKTRSYDDASRGADLVLTMTQAQKSDIMASKTPGRPPVMTLGEYCGGGGDVADPWGGGRDAYEDAFWDISVMVERTFTKIMAGGPEELG